MNAAVAAAAAFVPSRRSRGPWQAAIVRALWQTRPAASASRPRSSRPLTKRATRRPMLALVPDIPDEALDRAA